MTKRKPFQFKQFSIDDEGCGMKIGVDSVLLGSFVNSKFNPPLSLNAPNNILDIGSGSGVLTLMMAQKFPQAAMTSIELDPKSLEKSKENIANSEFVNSFTSVLGDYLNHPFDTTFDLIISNPPFYNEHTVSADLQRKIARSSQYLPLLDLLSKTKNILAATGSFYLCYPTLENLEETIQNTGWKIKSKLALVKNNDSVPKRHFLHLVHAINNNVTETMYSKISIEIERGIYTKEYIELTKDYYLNF